MTASNPDRAEPTPAYLITFDALLTFMFSAKLKKKSPMLVLKNNTLPIAQGLAVLSKPLSDLRLNKLLI